MLDEGRAPKLRGPGAGGTVPRARRGLHRSSARQRAELVPSEGPGFGCWAKGAPRSSERSGPWAPRFAHAEACTAAGRGSGPSSPQARGELW
eukprot:3746699-Alexandrium_andersonii.AAC.1